jgi:hypothetical protein
MRKRGGFGAEGGNSAKCEVCLGAESEELREQKFLLIFAFDFFFLGG